MVGEHGQVILADINATMLELGRDKLIDKGIFCNVDVVQANAESLPFPENSIDCIAIGFGLRNVTDKDLALESMLRVLQPGGRLLVLGGAGPAGQGSGTKARGHCP